MSLEVNDVIGSKFPKYSNILKTVTVSNTENVTRIIPPEAVFESSL